MTTGAELGFAEKVAQLVKLPFFIVFKVVIALLNLIPFHAYEVYGHAGYGPAERPDLREVFVHVQGKRRLHLGSFLIAYQRGVVFRANTMHPEQRFWGIYTEDYEAVQRKWTF